MPVVMTPILEAALDTALFSWFFKEGIDSLDIHLRKLGDNSCMDEDVTQHRADLMARVVLMAAAPLTAAVLLMAVVLVATGCAVVMVDQQAVAPEPVRLDVRTGEPHVAFTTPDGDSKDAQISVSAE